MKNFKFPKTPHGNPISHFFKMLAFFVFGAGIALVLNLGIVVDASLFMKVVFAFSIGLGSLLFGIFSTMILRTVFGLVQVGKIVQYISFCLVCVFVLFAHEYALASIELTIPFLAGLVIFVAAFLPATLVGVIPFKKRRWFPVPRKK